MPEWFYLGMILLATAANVLTAAFLLKTGAAGRKQNDMQHKVNGMLFERIVVLERSLGINNRKEQPPRH